MKAHVVYHDHSATTPFTFKSTIITGVDNLSNPCGTTITGQGEANGNPTPVDFSVTIIDGGEPGAGNDVFSIQVEAYSYSNGRLLSGGNIQKHNQTCPQ